MEEAEVKGTIKWLLVRMEVERLHRVLVILQRRVQKDDERKGKTHSGRDREGSSERKHQLKNFSSPMEVSSLGSIDPQQRQILLSSLSSLCLSAQNIESIASSRNQFPGTLSSVAIEIANKTREIQSLLLPSEGYVQPFSSPNSNRPPTIGNTSKQPSLNFDEKKEIMLLMSHVDQLIQANAQLNSSLNDAKTASEHWKTMYAKALTKGVPGAEEVLNRAKIMELEIDKLKKEAEKERFLSTELREQSSRQEEEFEQLYSELNKNREMYEELMQSVRDTAQTKILFFQKLISRIAAALSRPTTEDNIENLEELPRIIEDLSITCRRLKQENNRLGKEKEEYEELICKDEDLKQRERDRDRRHLQLRIRELEEEIRSRINDDKERIGQMEVMKQAVNELQSEMLEDQKIKQAALSESEERLHQSSIEIEELNRKHNTTQNESAALRESLSAVEFSAKESAIALKELRIKSTEELTHLRKLFENKETELRELKKQFSDLEATLQKKYEKTRSNEDATMMIVLFAFELERLHQIKGELIAYLESAGQENSQLISINLQLQEEKSKWQDNLTAFEEEKQMLKIEVERLNTDLQRITMNNAILQKDMNSFREKLELRDHLHDELQKQIAVENEIQQRQLDSVRIEKATIEILFGIEVERLTMNYAEKQIETSNRQSGSRPQHDMGSNQQGKEPRLSYSRTEETLSKSIVIEDKLKHLQDSLLKFEESLLQGKTSEKLSTFK